MATIITRETGATSKGAPLLNSELDQNFININDELVAHKNDGADPHPQYATPEFIGALACDMTGFVSRDDNEITFDEVTRTLTLTPDTSINVYKNAVAVSISAPINIVIDDITQGRYYGVNPATGQLIEIGEYPDFVTDIPVAYIYWDAVNNEALIFGDERHSAARDTQWHYSQHLDVGTVWRTGGAITFTLDDDTDVSFGLAGPLTIADEDLNHVITHAAIPSAPYEQFIEVAAKVPVVYLEGTGYKQTAPSDVPWVKGVSTAYYNQIIAGVGSLIEVSNSKFLVYWLVATNDSIYPVKLVMGQSEHGTIAEAEAEVFEAVGVSVPELVPMYKFILQTSSSYTGNTSAVIVRSVIVLTDRKSAAFNAFTATSHDALTEKTAPDQHPISAITALQPTLDTKADKTVAETFESTLTVKAGIMVGSAGLGNSAVEFWDDTNSLWRSLRWKDSTSKWQLEDVNGVFNVIYDEGSLTKAVVDALSINATALEGHPVSVSGNRYDVIPFVGAAGATEIGRYIDFHASDEDTSGYAARIGSDTNGDLTFTLGSTSGVAYISGHLNVLGYTQIANGPGASSVSYVDSYAATSYFIGRRAEGVLGTPTATLTDVLLSKFSGRGHNGSSWTSDMGGFQVRSVEAFTSTNQGTKLELFLTAVGENVAETVAEFGENYLTLDTANAATQHTLNLVGIRGTFSNVISKIDFMNKNTGSNVSAADIQVTGEGDLNYTGNLFSVNENEVLTTAHFSADNVWGGLATFTGEISISGGGANALRLVAPLDENVGIAFKDDTDGDDWYLYRVATNKSLVLSRRDTTLGSLTSLKISHVTGVVDLGVLGATVKDNLIHHDGLSSLSLNDVNFANAATNGTQLVTIDEIQFFNNEPSALTVDGALGWDASRGLLLYRAQTIGQATVEGVYTVLDSSNILGGNYLTITGVTEDAGGTEPITFTVNPQFTEEVTATVTNLSAFTAVVTDNEANAAHTAMYVDYNVSGDAALTADRAHIGFRMDLVSNATGGDTVNEHRLYGIWSSAVATGDSDLVYGSYNQATASHTVGTISTACAVWGSARSTAAGATTTLTGGKIVTDIDAGTIGTAYGLDVDIDIDGGTIGVAYGVHSQMDIDIGTITGNAYLFFGNYANHTNISGTAYGLHIADVDVENFLGGNLSVGLGITATSLRASVATNVTATSTLHAFQAGDDSLVNVGIGDNGIQARNNFVVATLRLNPAGGGVTINGNEAWHAGNLTKAVLEALLA